MMNTNPTDAAIIDAALTRTYTMTTLAALHDYMRDEMLRDFADRDELIELIDCDLRDMLHNANLDMIFDADDLAALDDDAYDMLADNLACAITHRPDMIIPTMIADALLDRIANA